MVSILQELQHAVEYAQSVRVGVSLRPDMIRLTYYPDLSEVPSINVQMGSHPPVQHRAVDWDHLDGSHLPIYEYLVREVKMLLKIAGVEITQSQAPAPEVYSDTHKFRYLTGDCQCKHCQRLRSTG